MYWTRCCIIEKKLLFVGQKFFSLESFPKLLSSSYLWELCIYDLLHNNCIFLDLFRAFCNCWAWTKVNTKICMKNTAHKLFDQVQPKENIETRYTVLIYHREALSWMWTPRLNPRITETQAEHYSICTWFVNKGLLGGATPSLITTFVRPFSNPRCIKGALFCQSLLLLISV